ncbi:MAG: thioredoxin-disulfide reductase [Magnetococcales bacterium]|nr:thioredoxin-disulfide reductase [Magnetococcales bacterium]MEC8067515.1 thioredoxin-disulfide reductase [Pseudomonadota bacterium]|tara:strand:- start:604 stop:1557 length:954 start_codon:yes stop_codon:yes gene_type:complete
MSNNIHRKVIILGSGPAGSTAAIYTARANLKPMLIHGLQPGGQMTITHEVENYPGFANVVEGPWLMDQFNKQAENCGTEMVNDTIVEVDLKQKPHVLKGDSGTTYTCDVLIVATGASAKWLGLESEQKFSGKGVSACATCDGAFFRGQDVVVVGGGNTAMEEALYLSAICKSVTVVHRRDAFRGEVVLRNRIEKTENIQVKWNSVVAEIQGTEGPLGGVTSVKLQNTEDGAYEEVPCHGVFIAIGHKPNTDLFKGQLDMDEYGYLEVEKGTVNTNVDGVFAAGDVADPIYRQAVTAAGLGCMAALDTIRYVEGLLEA